MNIRLGLISISVLLLACNVKTKNNGSDQTNMPLIGTWQLISGTLIEQGDTVVTDYTGNLSFIKIINDTHFAFLKHDLTKGKESPAFGSGGGRSSLIDSLYIEHLEYCSDREWEGNDFEFTITIRNDTLIQSGIEKVEGAGVNRLNIEKYFRVKN